VKLLDFGLAKAIAEEPSDSSNSPTMSLAMTSAGVILGTAAYMSPEQARGKPVDRRADIWAFGLVLLEALTGKQTYRGATIADTLASVMRDDPVVPADLPASIRTLLARCLDKDPRQRLRDIGEARIALEHPDMEKPAAPQVTRPRLVWAAAASMAAIAAAGWYAWYTASRPAAPLPLVQLTVELDPEARVLTRLGEAVTISNDGSRIATVLQRGSGNSAIYTRLLNQPKLTLLAGTDFAASLFFSPDAQWIGFAADGKLKKVPVNGGAAVTICDANLALGASWGEDDFIVFARTRNEFLWRVPAAGGKPEQLTKLNAGVERTHRWPQVLNGGQAVVFTAVNGADFKNGTIEALSVKTGERRQLVKGGTFGRYLPVRGHLGYLLYLHDGTLFAQRFNAESLTTEGAAAPVLEEVQANLRGAGIIGISHNGTVIFLRSSAGSTQLVSFDREGKQSPLLANFGSYASPRFSPDGKRLAYSLANGQGSDVWVKDVDRDSPSKLTFLPGRNTLPVWAPDGKWIVFSSLANIGNTAIYAVRSDGGGEVLKMTDENWIDPFPEGFSPDAKRLVLHMTGKTNSTDLFTAPVETTQTGIKLGRPELFFGTPEYREDAGRFSPDGRWMAYASNESLRPEVYVRPFPGPGGRWQISNGGSGPLWSRDGRELFYRSPTGSVMIVSYTAGRDAFIAGKPREWPTAVPLGIGAGLDVSPDGKHLVATLPQGVDANRPLNHLTFLFHFIDELQRKLPLK
jgi:serine/threonine-protein kinase